MFRPLSRQTLGLATQVRETVFFRNCGRPISDGTVVAARSWEEALHGLISKHWEDYVLDAQNELTETAGVCARAAFDADWNDSIGDIEGALGEDLRRRIASALPPSRKWANAVDVVHNMIVTACAEQQCARITRTNHFRRMLHWIMEGHLPCGATAEFPAGRIKVY